MRTLALLLAASGVFAGQDCDADHVSAFQMRTVAEGTKYQSQIFWTVSGKRCEGHNSSLSKDQCVMAASEVNRRRKMKEVPSSYRKSRPGGCYRYQRRFWFNPEQPSSGKVLTRGRKTVCLAETLGVLAGEVCFDDDVPTHFAIESECNDAAKLVNKYGKVKNVRSKYWQSRRPAGCYKFNGAVWWNAKFQNPEDARITMKRRERVCFPQHGKVDAKEEAWSRRSQVEVANGQVEEADALVQEAAALVKEASAQVEEAWARDDEAAKVEADAKYEAANAKYEAANAKYEAADEAAHEAYQLEAAKPKV